MKKKVLIISTIMFILLVIVACICFIKLKKTQVVDNLENKDMEVKEIEYKEEKNELENKEVKEKIENKTVEEEEVKEETKEVKTDNNKKENISVSKKENTIKEEKNAEIKKEQQPKANEIKENEIKENPAPKNNNETANEQPPKQENTEQTNTPEITIPEPVQNEPKTQQIDLSKYDFYENSINGGYKGFIRDSQEIAKLRNLINASINEFGYTNVSVVEDSSIAKSGASYFTANARNVENLVYDSEGFSIHYYAVKEYHISADGTETYFQTRSYIKVK